MIEGIALIVAGFCVLALEIMGHFVSELTLINPLIIYVCCGALGVLGLLRFMSGLRSFAEEW